MSFCTCLFVHSFDFSSSSVNVYRNSITWQYNNESMQNIVLRRENIGTEEEGVLTTTWLKPKGESVCRCPLKDVRGIRLNKAENNVHLVISCLTLPVSFENEEWICHEGWKSHFFVSDSNTTFKS